LHIQNNLRFIATDLLTEAGVEFFPSREGFFTGNLKINGRFGERAEKILVREQRAQDSRHHPQNQRALVGTGQAVSRHMTLPAWNKDHSLYRYGWPGSKFRARFAGVLLFVRRGDDIRRRRPGFAVALADCPLCGRTYPMTMNLSTEVRMIKGVGPQRAE